MGHCWHSHNEPWCPDPAWHYMRRPGSGPTRRRGRRTGDLGDYVDFLEEELQRVREELAETRADDRRDRPSIVTE